jgi:CRP/FNR family transcriptional regulator, cyclic AMP receptor protein
MNHATDELTAALHRSPLGAGLDAAELAALASVVRLASFQRGSVLAREGTTDHQLVAVVDGTLQIIKGIDGDKGEILSILKPGHLTHELGFLDGSQRYASLVAAEDSSVLLLERVGLESLIDRAPRVLYHVMCAIVHSAHQAQTRLAVQSSELTNYIVKQHGRY